jgi:hypothetical protein
MTGTASQIEWAELIRPQVNAEFDRVTKAFQGAASNQAEPDRAGFPLSDDQSRPEGGVKVNDVTNKVSTLQIGRLQGRRHSQCRGEGSELDSLPLPVFAVRPPLFSVPLAGTNQRDYLIKPGGYSRST